MQRFDGGALVILKTNEGKFVLVKQYSIREDRILWTFPGGNVRRNESFEHCAIREVKEETGLNIAVTGLHVVFRNVEKNSSGEELEW
ncbi:MAG: NUDIX hydrolase [Candidatus Bathyarchaeia archaeon]